MKKLIEMARFLLGIKPDTVVKQEDIDRLINWVEENKGKYVFDAHIPAWLSPHDTHRAQGMYTMEAWPGLEIDLLYYDNLAWWVLSPTAFKRNNVDTLGLLQFLANGCKQEEVEEGLSTITQGRALIKEGRRMLSKAGVPQVLIQEVEAE